MQGLWSLIGKIGTGAAQNFPYEIGEKIGTLEDKSVWTLHEGKKKVSWVFEYLTYLTCLEIHK